LFAAIGKGGLRALDGRQLQADGLRGQVVQLLLIQARAGETQLQDGHAGGVVLDDEGRRGTRRQRAQLHLSHGLADIDIGMEEDLDDSDAHQRLRLDVVDIVDRGGHAALGIAHDAVGNLIRRKTAVVPHHGDHRYIDVGKDVRRHRLDAVDAKDQDEQREDDKGIRPPQRKPDNPHHSAGIRSSAAVLMVFRAVTDPPSTAAANRGRF
jgi:hypothetical protein